MHGIGFGGAFFAAESECVFADFDGALEEVEAAIVLGKAFAGDLDALDVEFVFFVAMNQRATRASCSSVASVAEARSKKWAKR